MNENVFSVNVIWIDCHCCNDVLIGYANDCGHVVVPEVLVVFPKKPNESFQTYRVRLDRPVLLVAAAAEVVLKILDDSIALVAESAVVSFSLAIYYV